jgi:serine/threonine protein kinase/Tol biopolymer transport system component
LSITVGTQLGSYEITALLGKGGMGEVYRALDTKLKREVAIKSLPEEFARDADRISRFRREGELLASLNHPNIAAIYDLQEANNTRFLVLELVEGETLADRIRRGPIQVDEAIHIARQIAEALEAAHTKNVVHRDLKPANVKITLDHTVKVLDFGLAKVFDSESSTSDFSKSPTLISGTLPGVILGTAAYMSPEQARGQGADAQSDIWAFGCVLYELLTGKQPFTGETVTDVLGCIVRVDPDWTELPSSTPPLVRLLLRQCLQKSRNVRLRHIGDAKIQIDAALTESSASAREPVRTRQLPWFWIAACAVLLLVLAGMTVYIAGYFRPVSNDALIVRLSVPPPEKTSFNSAGGVNAPYVSISPDGKHLAFIAVSDNVRRIWIRSLDSLEARPLPGTDDVAAYPMFWSPDSRYVAFGHEGKLKKIEVAGGRPQTLCDAPNYEGGTWNRDGVILFDQVGQGEGPIKRVSAAGGTTEAITMLDRARQEQSHAWPYFLPDGDHFLFLARTPSSENSAIFVSSLSSKETKFVLKVHSRMAYDHSGFLLFVRDASLMAQPFDVGASKVTGDPFPIAEQVRYNPLPAQASLAVSDNGVLAYRTGDDAGKVKLVWVDRSGKSLGEAAPAGTYKNPELSPDGSRVVVQQRDPKTTTDDIWFIDTTRGVSGRLTSNPEMDVFPVWSPDGTKVLFQRGTPGGDIYVVPSNGSGTEELVLKAPARLYGWSGDGRLLIYGSNGLDILSVAIFGDRKPALFVKSEFTKLNAQLSPDGRWMAYQSNESSRADVYVQSFPNPSDKWKVSPAGGVAPRWRGDSKELFYVGPDRKLMSVSIRTSGTKLELSSPVRLFDISPQSGFPLRNAYDVTRDGQRFLVTSPVESADTPITVVVNWAAGIKK